MIPGDVCWLLSLGKKFALPLNDDEFPVFNLISDSEFLLQSVKSEQERDDKRVLVANIIGRAGTFKAKQKSDRQRYFTHKQEYEDFLEG